MFVAADVDVVKPTATAAMAVNQPAELLHVLYCC